METSYKRKNYHNKPKGNWHNYNNKKFKNYLTAGMSGFLCTCNFQNREKDCIRESIKILEEYSEKFPETDPSAPAVEPQTDEQEEDIETQLKKEVESLQTEKNWRHSDGKKNQRFTVVDTGVKSIVFISAAVEDPVKLARAILDDAFETKVQKTRFLLRIIPVEVICKTNLDDMKAAAENLFKKHFCCDPTTFAIHINKRCNDKICRDEVIKALAVLVTDRNPDHKANLKEPQKTILVEIIKGLCCISVLEDYKKLKHYNLAELTKSETEDKTETADKSGETEVKMEETGDQECAEEPEEKEDTKNLTENVTEIQVEDATKDIPT